jgi:LacI family transcriptional regulator
LSVTKREKSGRTSQNVVRGHGRVTNSDVARAAGVSTASVSRVLNGKRVTAEVRASVERAVELLGYHPNSAARTLMTRSTESLALMCPDIANPFFPELVKGVQRAANRAGYTVLLCNTDSDPQAEQRYFKMLIGRQIDGVLLVGLAGDLHNVDILHTNGIAVVAIDRNIDRADVPNVHVDHYKGARIAAQYLIELGHRRIAHIQGPRSLQVTKERDAGYRHVLSSAGIVCDSDLVVEGDFSEPSGYDATRRLLERNPECTAIFASNDLMAIGAMIAAKELGRDIPGDLSIVGFDDISLASYVSPSLTTVRQPVYELGTRAAECVIAELRRVRERRTTVAPGTVICDPELVVRDSSGPVKQAEADGVSRSSMKRRRR